jgi:hypothetical protein
VTRVARHPERTARDLQRPDLRFLASLGMTAHRSLAVTFAKAPLVNTNTPRTDISSCPRALWMGALARARSERLFVACSRVNNA